LYVTYITALCVPAYYPSSPTRRSSDLGRRAWEAHDPTADWHMVLQDDIHVSRNLLDGLELALDQIGLDGLASAYTGTGRPDQARSEEHTSELQSRDNLVCRLLLEKKNWLTIYACHGTCTSWYPGSLLTSFRLQKPALGSDALTYVT